MTEPRRRRRVFGLLIAGLALLTGVTLVDAAANAGRSTVRTGGPAVGWASVVRSDLVATVPVQGALAYQGDTTLYSERAGVAYTRLPVAGEVIWRGQLLAAVDDQPTFLFYGRVPEWRDLGPWVLDGPDVAELNANLVALHYATAAAVGADRDAYDVETELAVERWQRAKGLPATGVVPLGTILFAPGPVRVRTLDARLGSPAQPGAPLLEAGAPTPVVDVPLPVGDESLVRAGEAVTVTLPDGHSIAPGRIATVAPVATAAPGSGGQPTVAVTVKLLGRARLSGSIDQAPVAVSIVTGRVKGALAVPVNALVALAGGGYAVDVETLHGVRLVAVQTGLAAGGLVQVRGALSTSERVEVPAS